MHGANALFLCVAASYNAFRLSYIRRSSMRTLLAGIVMALFTLLYGASATHGDGCGSKSAAKASHATESCCAAKQSKSSTAASAQHSASCEEEEEDCCSKEAEESHAKADAAEKQCCRQTAKQTSSPSQSAEPNR